jgi:hypothetical protein
MKGVRPDGPTAAPATTRPRVLALFFLVLVLASTRLLAASYWKAELFGDRSPLLYQAGTLSFNYIEMGAIRRGLGGTLAHLLSGDMLLATVAFHLLSAAAVALAGCVLLARVQGTPATRAAAAMALLAIMLRWAEDAGRTDMAVAALLGAAAWATTRHRLALACALVGLGLFIHESAFIYGLPLLAALVWCQGWRTYPRRAWQRTGVVLALALVAYLAMAWLPHADLPTMVRTVRAKFPPSKFVDWAIYFALSGARGVRTSICQNATDPSYWIHPFGGAVAIAAAALAVVRRPAGEWPALLVAALPPFAFLCVVANDISRWTMLAAFNVWLLSIATSGRQPAARIPGAIAFAAAVALLVLTHPKPYKIDYPIYAGSPIIEKIAHRLHGPRTPSVEEALARCDPSWREALGDPPDASIAAPALNDGRTNSGRGPGTP